MKRMKFMMFAILMLLATPVFLTSCQEDAPEIDYTINVSVINDFTKVVDAINNGTLKNEAAIEAIAKAIDKMNTDQAGKLQTVTDVLNAVNVTLETKLAALDGSMQSQTLSLESKFALLEQALNNQTVKLEDLAGKFTIAVDQMDSSQVDKQQGIIAVLTAMNDMLSVRLTAIEGAMNAQTLDFGRKLDVLTGVVEGLPDYSEKFDAAVTGLESIATQLEAMGTSQATLATQVTQAVETINGLKQSLALGAVGAAKALEMLLQKLDEIRAAIGGGGSIVPDADVVFLCNGAADEAIMETNLYIPPSERSYDRLTLVKDGKKLVLDITPLPTGDGYGVSGRIDLSVAEDNPLAGHPDRGVSLIDEEGNETRWNEVNGLFDAGSWMQISLAPPVGAPRKSRGGSLKAPVLPSRNIGLQIHATATRDGKKYLIDVNVGQPFQVVSLPSADYVFNCTDAADGFTFFFNTHWIPNQYDLDLEQRVIGGTQHLRMSFDLNLPDYFGRRIDLSSGSETPILYIAFDNKDNSRYWGGKDGWFEEDSWMKLTPLEGPNGKYKLEVHATATRDGKSYKIDVDVVHDFQMRPDDTPDHAVFNGEDIQFTRGIIDPNSRQGLIFEQTWKNLGLYLDFNRHLNKRIDLAVNEGAPAEGEANWRLGWYDKSTDAGVSWGSDDGLFDADSWMKITVLHETPLHEGLDRITAKVEVHATGTRDGRKFEINIDGTYDFDLPNGHGPI
ncbi:MAG: hypothetical protein ACOYJK_02925 [Prevotella sp.]|jgi:hypothetical protein